jgi:hypothetical protein
MHHDLDSHDNQDISSHDSQSGFFNVHGEGSWNAHNSAYEMEKMLSQHSTEGLGGSRPGWSMATDAFVGAWRNIARDDVAYNQGYIPRFTALSRFDDKPLYHFGQVRQTLKVMTNFKTGWNTWEDIATYAENTPGYRLPTMEELEDPFYNEILKRNVWKAYLDHEAEHGSGAIQPHRCFIAAQDTVRKETFKKWLYIGTDGLYQNGVLPQYAHESSTTTTTTTTITYDDDYYGSSYYGSSYYGSSYYDDDYAARALSRVDHQEKSDGQWHDDLDEEENNTTAARDLHVVANPNPVETTATSTTTQWVRPSIPRSHPYRRHVDKKMRDEHSNYNDPLVPGETVLFENKDTYHTLDRIATSACAAFFVDTPTTSFGAPWDPDNYPVFYQRGTLTVPWSTTTTPHPVLHIDVNVERGTYFDHMNWIWEQGYQMPSKTVLISAVQERFANSVDTATEEEAHVKYQDLSLPLKTQHGAPCWLGYDVPLDFDGLVPGSKGSDIQNKSTNSFGIQTEFGFTPMSKSMARRKASSSVELTKNAKKSQTTQSGKKRRLCRRSLAVLLKKVSQGDMVSKGSKYTYGDDGCPITLEGKPGEIGMMWAGESGWYDKTLATYTPEAQAPYPPEAYHVIGQTLKEESAGALSMTEWDYNPEKQALPDSESAPSGVSLDDLKSDCRAYMVTVPWEYRAPALNTTPVVVTTYTPTTTMPPPVLHVEVNHKTVTWEEAAAEIENWVHCEGSEVIAELANPPEHMRSYSGIEPYQPSETYHRQGMIRDHVVESGGAVLNSNTGGWVEIDLGQDLCVSGVVTQPRGVRTWGSQAVTEYYVQWRRDGSDQWSSQVGPFVGNMNVQSDEQVRRNFAAVRARYVWLQITGCYTHCSFRAGLMAAPLQWGGHVPRTEDLFVDFKARTKVLKTPEIARGYNDAPCAIPTLDSRNRKEWVFIGKTGTYPETTLARRQLTLDDVKLDDGQRKQDRKRRNKNPLGSTTVAARERRTDMSESEYYDYYYGSGYGSGSGSDGFYDGDGVETAPTTTTTTTTPWDPEEFEMDTRDTNASEAAHHSRIRTHSWKKARKLKRGAIIRENSKTDRAERQMISSCIGYTREVYWVWPYDKPPAAEVVERLSPNEPYMYFLVNVWPPKTYNQVVEALTAFAAPPESWKVPASDGVDPEYFAPRLPTYDEMQAYLSGKNPATGIKDHTEAWQPLYADTELTQHRCWAPLAVNADGHKDLVNLGPPADTLLLSHEHVGTSDYSMIEDSSGDTHQTSCIALMLPGSARLTNADGSSAHTGVDIAQIAGLMSSMMTHQADDLASYNNRAILPYVWSTFTYVTTPPTWVVDYKMQVTMGWPEECGAKYVPGSNSKCDDALEPMRRALCAFVYKKTDWAGSEFDDTSVEGLKTPFNNSINCYAYPKVFVPHKMDGVFVPGGPVGETTAAPTERVVLDWQNTDFEPAEEDRWKTYWPVSPGANWATALANCKARGATLATVKDSGHQAQMTARCPQCWIGVAQNNGNNNGWSWDTADIGHGRTTPAYLNWMYGEPNDGGHYQCNPHNCNPHSCGVFWCCTCHDTCHDWCKNADENCVDLHTTGMNDNQCGVELGYFCGPIEGTDVPPAGDLPFGSNTFDGETKSWSGVLTLRGMIRDDAEYQREDGSTFMVTPAQQKRFIERGAESKLRQAAGRDAAASTSLTYVNMLLPDWVEQQAVSVLSISYLTVGDYDPFAPTTTPQPTLNVFVNIGNGELTWEEAEQDIISHGGSMPTLDELHKAVIDSNDFYYFGNQAPFHVTYPLTHQCWLPVTDFRDEESFRKWVYVGPETHPNGSDLVLPAPPPVYENINRRMQNGGSAWERLFDLHTSSSYLSGEQEEGDWANGVEKIAPNVRILHLPEGATTTPPPYHPTAAEADASAGFEIRPSIGTVVIENAP